MSPCTTPLFPYLRVQGLCRPRDDSMRMLCLWRFYKGWGPVMISCYHGSLRLHRFLIVLIVIILRPLCIVISHNSLNKIGAGRRVSENLQPSSHWWLMRYHTSPGSRSDNMELTGPITSWLGLSHEVTWLWVSGHVTMTCHQNMFSVSRSWARWAHMLVNVNVSVP